MNSTLKSIVEEELQKAYERGVQDGKKQERALWELSRIGQEIEHVHAVNISEERVHKTEKNEHAPVGRFAKFSDGIWKEVTDGSAGQPLYTAPPQREWVGLTDDDVEYAIAAIYKGFDINPRNQIEIDYLSRVIKTVEAKLKEKNT